jgi:hypothetical protein
MCGSRNIRVPKHDHILIVAVLQVGIKFMLGREVVGSQFDVVVVVKDGKGALEQRVNPISSDDDPCPSTVGPTPIVFADPGLSFEDLVMMSNNRLRMGYLAGFIQVLHRRSFG